MALINCEECGKEMSDSARICPHCGYRKPRKKMAKKDKILYVVAFIIITFAIILILMRL